MELKLLFLIFPLCVMSYDFDILAIKRGDEVTSKVLDDIYNGRFIGCNFQNICPIGRTCFNDRLFGSCLSDNDDRNFYFELSPLFSSWLERSMAQLWEQKLHWGDFYTQCFLQSALRASEVQVELDVTRCSETPESDEKLSKDRDKLAERLMESIDAMNVRSRTTKKNSEERINPKSNSEEAVSTTVVRYEDPQLIRKTLKVAKRQEEEWIWLRVDKSYKKEDEDTILETVSRSFNIPRKMIKSEMSPDKSTLYFHLPDQFPSTNITDYFNNHRNLLEGLSIVDSGVGRVVKARQIPKNGNFVITLIICSLVLFVMVLVFIGFCVQKFRYKRDKMGDIIHSRFADTASSYKDLFRVSSTKESAALKSKQGVSRMSNKQHSGDTPVASSPVSTRSSTSSWTDDIPSTTNMDIYTGHMILSYMEKHLKNRDMFQAEWNSIKTYEAEESATDIATMPDNVPKNRYQDKIPYDKSRVVLKNPKNGDYVNASLIVDSDPRLPAYIAAQSPTENTIMDFWQMIWEQGVVVIVNLTEMDEPGVCRYWPKEGSDIYNTYEINLVSEHIWSDEYLVRNFYLKNLENAETKTVTQFHFYSWPSEKLPSSSRSILEFRRKVNKSYRSKTTPILVHCRDGCGRSGTYILLDLILNRVGKGLKEMDIAATLEHLRDQRMHLVNTEGQFGFVLNTISEEVNNILKIVNQ